MGSLAMSNDGGNNTDRTVGCVVPCIHAWLPHFGCSQHSVIICKCLHPYPRRRVNKKRFLASLYSITQQFPAIYHTHKSRRVWEFDNAAANWCGLASRAYWFAVSALSERETGSLLHEISFSLVVQSSGGQSKWWINARRSNSSKLNAAAAENSHSSDASLSVFKYRAIKVTAGLPHLCTRFICTALINNLNLKLLLSWESNYREKILLVQIN